MGLMKVELKSSRGFDAERLIINGEDFTGHASGVTIEVGVAEPTRVDVRLVVVEAEFHGLADVRFEARKPLSDGGAWSEVKRIEWADGTVWDIAGEPGMGGETP